MEARLLRAVGFFLFLSLAAPGLAQQFSPQPLITQPINESQLTTLKGNTHPLAQPQFDIGIAAPTMPLQRMLLVLKRNPQQDFALRKLLDDQQDKASPNYHKWVTPDEFGVNFGPSDQDMQLVIGWLQSHGFQVNRVAHGRSVIEFSGVESQVEAAFHSQIHAYLVNGQQHWANASNPQIPAALAPAVAGVWSLHDFRKKPTSRLSSQHFPIPQPGGSPLLTSSGQHALMPGDFATIYNIAPLYSAALQGQGATIAVVARSNFQQTDALDFHTMAGIPLTFVNIVNDGIQPGIFDPNEEAEADLDATWSSAVAPYAQVNFVVSASTNTTDGVDLSELDIIDNNLGDVMTESFGSCEGAASQAEASGLSLLAQQAAAQGITYMVSSGDSGAEACDDPNGSSANGDPPSVNVLASSAFTVAVGGTEFNEAGNDTRYWNATNNPATLASAKSYIPENVWNESCASCGLWAGGGGASVFFSKPNWQFGVAGIPSDGARDLPDVSLTAALHDPYLLCFEGSCNRGFLIGIGGTSAAAPSFAAIMALVVEQYGRQGQANYVLYRLAAAETLSGCNGSNTTTLPASTCVFNDGTSGNNAVPGELGFGTSSAKYQAATGYDLATGLGSVNVTNLVNQWNTVTFTATTTTLAPAAISTTHGSSVPVTVSVAPTSGSGVPTGDVSLLDTFTENSPAFFTLSNGSVSASVSTLPGGVYNLTARYGGDLNFAPSNSSPISVNITPEHSTTTASVLTADQNGNPIPLTVGTFGGFAYPRVDVAGQSGHGIPTGFAYFSDNGNQFGSRMDLNSQGYTVFPYGYEFFSPGQHAVTVFYAGDSSFNPSTSAPVTFSITPATTSSTLSASPNAVASAGLVTLTATVASTAFAGQSSATFPFGTVTFFSGNTQLGTAQLVATNAITQNGVTSFGSLATSALANGQNSITAQYGGDMNYLASASAPIVVTVQPDFTFSASGANITVPNPGGSGNLTVIITGQTGYTGTVNFTPASCAGLPFGASCAFVPSSVTGSGNTTITVSTLAPVLGSLGHFGWTTTGLVFAGVFLLGVPRRRFRSGACLSIVLLAFAAVGTGCGGGGGGGGGGHQSPGTPVGSYPITVTATSGTGSNAITHTTTFTLVVN